MNARFLSIALVFGILAASSAPVAADQGTPPVRTVTLIVNDPIGDKMSYSINQIDAKPGERLKVRLVSLAQTPKTVMAHNWVLLKLGTNVKTLTDAAANARATDFIPVALRSQIIADIPLTGPGEQFDVTFTVPKVRGSYPFVCTFAGHWSAGMKGTLVVK